VTAERAREITSGLGVPLVLVSADLTVETLVRSAQTAGAAVLQLHGNETPTMVRSVREAGDWSIWKALRVQGPDDVARGVGAFHDVVDALVLDSWDPERLGGTGVRFGWEQVARAHPEPRSGLAWVVAGGLSAENVAEAIRTLSPDVVDVSSGVESSVGVKDCEYVEAFIRAARGAGG